MDDLPRAARAVPERRLLDVALGEVDVLALLDVADAALSTAFLTASRSCPW